MLFVDPVFGTPLSIYIDTKVDDRDELVPLVKDNGGIVAPSYSNNVPYILVDPRKQSGQSLYRQFAHKKGRIVLNARWIHECVKAKQLQTYLQNWAGCKVDGTEPQIQDAPNQQPTIHAPHPQPPPAHIPFQAFSVEQQWDPPPTIQPEPTHPSYGDERWNQYSHSTSIDYRFRPDENNWSQSQYYVEPAFAQTYTMDEEEDSTPEAGPSTRPATPPEKARGRKRVRTAPTPAPPATTLIANRRLPARSPTPPARIVKSTYGGNLFTADDVIYLKKYIRYCHEQGMVLSLREICERVAVKAPHHTFYSWRRYCNKHQIRLGGYQMNADAPNDGEEANEVVVDPTPSVRPPGGSIHHLRHHNQPPTRDRSPTPPRTLFRSTTGKGVAFTDEDITFLVRFLAYRKSQGKVDMVAFWKDVATKAPHHSRASWMKFWRRHKHELEPDNNGVAPAQDHPDKKKRYSRSDDILLARYFVKKVDGTSDKIFQEFARQHPSHPWKGWQEHFRIHKKKIDHLIEQLNNGEELNEDELS